MELMTLDRNRLEQLRNMSSEGHPEFLIEMIDLFLEEAERDLGVLKDSLFHHNADDVRFEAHALRASAMNLGAVRLGLLLRNLEEEASSGDLGDFKQIEAEYLRVKQVLGIERNHHA